MPRSSPFTALLCAVILIALTAALPAQAQKAVALPVDEASQDPDFFAFRARLIALVSAKDVEGVVANTCSDIHLGFDGSAGHDDLREFLTVPENLFAEEYKHLAPKMRAENWGNLLKVLTLGGQFDAAGEFWAPYTWNAKVPDSFDPYSTYFITGSDVLMRDAPSKDGTAIDSLSYNIVTVPWLGEEQNSEDAIYLPVERPGGKLGYVHRDFLRSQIDYRASFSKREQGKWKMCLFLAGD